MITLQDELNRIRQKAPDFVNVSGGGGGPIGIGSGGGGFPTGGPSAGRNVPLPNIGINAGSGSSGPSLSGSIGSSISNWLFGPFLLRIVFLILGLIAVVGAIYLFKDTRFVVQPLVDGAKETAKAVGASAVA